MKAGYSLLLLLNINQRNIVNNIFLLICLISLSFFLNLSEIYLVIFIDYFEMFMLSVLANSSNCFFSQYMTRACRKREKKSLSRQQWHQFWPKQKYIKVMVGHAKRGETGDDLSHLFCDKRVVSSQHLILASHLCT